MRHHDGSWPFYTSMTHVEQAHYNVWAERLESELHVAYPCTFWMVLRHAEHQIGDPWRIDIPWDGGPLPRFRLIAVKLGTGRSICEDVPFTLVVDEEAFTLVVQALGRDLEWRLAVIEPR